METKMKEVGYPHQTPSKAKALMQALDSVTGTGSDIKREEPPQNETGKETVSDDFELSKEEVDRIQQTEETVREVLKLFELDYDALVRMDDQSLYARAVKENPAVLMYVKQSANPVLEALKIAIGFKPYAEFIEKYGKDPESIKKAMRAEFEAEQAKNKKSSQEGSSFTGTPFSSLIPTKEEPSSPLKENSLSSIFDK